jgi:hypothetical protein
MFLILYPFYAIASLLFVVVTMIFAPLIAKFVDAEGNLPKWLSWFQTFDATLFEGRQPQYGFTGTDEEVATKWLRRNPGYTFDYEPLGVAWDKTQWTATFVKTQDGTTRFFAKGPNGQFNYEYGGKHLQVKLGWKAFNLYNADTGTYRDGNWGPLPRIPVCFTIKPVL